MHSLSAAECLFSLSNNSGSVLSTATSSKVNLFTFAQHIYMSISNSIIYQFWFIYIFWCVYVMHVCSSVPSSMSIFFYCSPSDMFRQVISLNLVLTGWLVWLSTKPQWSCQSLPLNSGITGTCHHVLLFMWVLGIWVQVFILLHSKQFTSLQHPWCPVALILYTQYHL